MKRVFCLLICTLVLMMSFAIVPASAEEVETSTDFIYFKVPTEPNVAWKNFKQVFCHIWSEGADGGDFFNWQAKAERCTDLGNGYWAYDISELDFDENKSYALIFSNNNNLQTYNLTVTSDCRGDIVVCDGDTCENPVDSEKTCTVARWTVNADKVHPCVQLSSNGITINPDGVAVDSLDTKWGTGEGVTTTIEVGAAEENTDNNTDSSTDNNSPDTGFNYEAIEITTGADAEEDNVEENKHLSNILNGGGTALLIAGIAIAAAIVIAGAVIVVVVIKKKKKAQ